MPPTNKRISARAPAQTNEPPRDQEEFRRALVSKIRSYFKTWRACPARSCARHRRCVSAKFECSAQSLRREQTPDQQKAMLAHLRRALARRLGEREEAGK